MSKLKTGDDLSWKWGKGTGEGTVTETFTHDVTRKIKTIKRKADEEEPAVLVCQEDGDRVLKSASEVKKA
jgi:Hypervirulence associated proteins TUDOR domain